MRRAILKISSVFLLFILTFSLSSFSVAAATQGEARVGAPSEKSYLSVTGIGNKNVYSHSAIAIYLNGKSASYRARVINGEAYIPIRRIVSDLTVATAVYNSASKILTVYGGGYDISVSDGAFVLYASGRPIFSMTPSQVLSDGEMYVPASTVAKAFGLSYSTQSGSVSFRGTASPITAASRFYREDEVYWLSRIINAESRGESLLGQIAVGNVVLNRMRSSLYPNTIWGVIFDKKYGVQFSPIIDGSIYAEPTYTAVLAAKICLEGFSLSNDTLFFLYPSASTSSWIPRTREYAFSIGKHDFYR